MKLVFPGGEHAAFELGEGVVTIGRDRACTVVIDRDGIAPKHCEITARGEEASVRALDPTQATVLNGRQVAAATPIKDGDLIVIGRVGCSVVGERKEAITSPAAERDASTRVRSALPKFVLRGVSGPTLGKTFAVTSGAIIGRQADADIAIPADEVSRQHARLKVTADGVMVEDLGSANGTFIGNQRVTQNALLKPGDELRLDTIRFLLIAPGMDARQQSAAAKPEPTAASAPGKGGNSALWIVLGVLVVAAIAAVVLHQLKFF
ncbi:MAG: FHA domain-containing protein [Dokdonella sp.]|uniref:FHA domain-containing protein n=1 Tax=Dokdonella sp. TaxID=2291710 RepID=UPI0025BC9F8D|nr:FHA domain-containing protein [Dokdonella sp.]MBZ0223108.1 FHA domain-containing protein [Dokdonella sp.]MCC7254980.1 FHA domain-containing protein [Dokdonella sp.]